MIDSFGPDEWTRKVREGLEEHIQWLNAHQFDPGTADEICQCGTEVVIKRSSNPKRMRAELMSYVFLDQFIYTHFHDDHYNFKKIYRGPMLCGHSFGGHASPGWFVYSYWEFDKMADWQLVRSTFSDYMTGGLAWLGSRRSIDENNFWALVKEEICLEFEIENRPKLVSAICDSPALVVRGISRRQQQFDFSS